MQEPPPSDTPGLDPGEAATVTSFVDAVNSGDAPAAARCFAPDAQVNDQLRNFWGHRAIGEWLEREIIGERVHINVVDTRRHRDTVILSTELWGDFEAVSLTQPVLVDLYITVKEGQIVRLLLLMVREDGDGIDIRKAS